MMFSHWTMIAGDVLEEGSMVNNIVMAVRKRKGLKEELPDFCTLLTCVLCLVCAFIFVCFVLQMTIMTSFDDKPIARSTTINFVLSLSKKEHAPLHDPHSLAFVPRTVIIMLLVNI